MDNDYRASVKQLLARQNPQSDASRQVLNYLETLLDAVSIDSGALAKGLEAALSDEALDERLDKRGVIRKIADKLMNFFGLNLVSKGDCVTISGASCANGGALLTLKPDAENAVSAILSVVDDMGKERTSALTRVKQLENTVSSVSRDADLSRQGQNDLQREAERKDKEILKAIQRILAQKPDLKPAESGEKDALLLFLDDLDITWSWDATGSPENFTTYTISDSDAVGVRMPCLYRDGKTVVKGLQYTL